MKRSSIGDQRCPVARGAPQLTDAWTLLILRELFAGNRRFEGLRVHTGMSPRSLALRLAQLVDHGILTKDADASAAPAAMATSAPSGTDAAPKRPRTTPGYRLTPKGLDLWPLLVVMRQWGERWAGPWGEDGVPVRLGHRGHGHALTVALHCQDCGEPVDARSAEVQAAPEVLAERAAAARTARARHQ